MELFDYLSTIYDDDTLMIILDFESYYEIMYTVGYVAEFEQTEYELNKLKDPTKQLEVYGKQLFELNKSQIDKNLKRKN
jgi:hypothetical protein